MKVRGVSTRASAHSADVTTLVVAFAVLGAVGAPGCSTNSVDPGDAGAPAQDIGPYVVDIRPVPYPTYCGDDGPCPAGTECREEGFCSYSWYDVCAFDDAGRAVQVTLNGDPCAITDVSPSGSAWGIGMPAAFCTALADPQSYEALQYGEVFPTGCRWSDGSVLATPSEDACYGIPFSPGPSRGCAVVLLRRTMWQRRLWRDGRRERTARCLGLGRRRLRTRVCRCQRRARLRCVHRDRTPVLARTPLRCRGVRPLADRVLGRGAVLRVHVHRSRRQRARGAGLGGAAQCLSALPRALPRQRELPRRRVRADAVRRSTACTTMDHGAPASRVSAPREHARRSRRVGSRSAAPLPARSRAAPREARCPSRGSA
jgi:hypothetical protein